MQGAEDTVTNDDPSLPINTDSPNTDLPDQSSIANTSGKQLAKKSSKTTSTIPTRSSPRKNKGLHSGRLDPGNSQHSEIRSALLTESSEYSTTNNNSKNINLRIDSLNCRSLAKPNQPTVSSEFIRFLRSQQFDLVTLQETHASDPETQQTLDMKFQAKSSIWSRHCGIVSLNSSIVLSSSLISIDQRLIACTISHTGQVFEPFTIVTIYASASPQPRREFYHHIMQLPVFSTIPRLSIEDVNMDDQSSDQPFNHRMLITGDFNYSPSFSSQYTTSTPQVPFRAAQRDWHDFLLTNFNEFTHPSLDNPLPTFRRGTTSSTIDYIFGSLSLFPCVQKSNIEFINSTWTDHALLSIQLKFGSGHHGKGLWRANPYLATNSYFVKTLYRSLDWFCSSRVTPPFDIGSDLRPSPVETSQSLWEAVKVEVKRVARSFGRKQASWQQLHLSRLQAKRDRLLSSQSPTSGLHPSLTRTEKLIGHLQTDMAKTQILKASKHWREHGETSAGYLKRSIETRTSQRYIPSLQHPSDSHLCTSPGELQDAAETFYQHLYTSETIDDTNVSILLDTITENDIIPADDTDFLLVPFTIEDLLVGSSRSPRKSSPGTDGLPYEILSTVLKHPGISNLAVKMYNDALLQGIFPRSWLSTSTALLPKKGDLTSLKNWRPISLINTDAKIFTRLLNSRLTSVFSSRISPYQMGFMPQRFIGEHGRLLQLIMSSASIQKSSAVGLLLDQEKAYDRVHPEYLSQVMRRFGVPAQLVSTTIQLFFSTRISININGYLTGPFTAQRGLRQGDPLSPLLYNIAFDPFLRLISSDSLFQGYSFVSSSDDGSSGDGSSGDDLFPAPVEADPPSVDPVIQTGHSPPPVKVFAYADDVLVFLKSPSDFNRLQQAVSIYASASNAILNYSKTQAFSLSRDPNPTWQQFLTTQNIHSWHDCRSTDSLIYLGYPGYSSTSQRNLFVDQLTNKIALSCQIHSQRNLSIRGRVTVLNCLIFSKLWHVLRIVPLTQVQIAKIQGLGAKFLNSNSFPRISFATLCLPRTKGGLGALDPAAQIQALQWRWLLPMLLPSSPDPSRTALFPRLLYPSVPYGQYLLQVNSRHDHLPPRLLGISSLLFAAYRSSHFSSSSLHCFTSFFSALDSLLCRAFDRVVLTPDTALTLPLSSLIQVAPIAPSHPPLVSYTPSLPQVCHKPIFRLMTGSHLMILDSTTRCLRYRTFTRSEIQQFSRTTKQLINLLTSNTIQLRQSVSTHFTTPAINSDFIDFSPIILSIFDADSIPQIPTRLLSTSPKIFKYLSTNKQHFHHSCSCPASKTPFSYNTDLRYITPTQWSSFWQLSIPLRARTVWFKIIHRCIPYTSILHRFIPQKFPSALCPLCLMQPDSLLHFFYTCSKIQPVWIQIASLFIEQGWQHVIQFFLSDISSAVARLSDFPLRDPSIALVPTLSTSQIVACTLQAIWSSHWLFIFQDVPFVPATVALKASASIYQLANELDPDSDIL